MDRAEYSVPKLDSEPAVLHFCALGIADLAAIIAIEEAVYAHPWTRGNFLDSFYSNHQACGLRDDRGELIGYFFAMAVLDELHLLTIAVAKHRQKQGCAKLLLERLIQLAREQGFESVLLEVRVSNARAIAIYEQFGFGEIGRRKGYYPADQGRREDAIVMRISC